MDRPTATLARFAAGWETHSPAETEAAGAALAEVLPLNTALALHGDLGAGKTTLVRGLARGVGASKARWSAPPSTTFSSTAAPGSSRISMLTA